MPMPDHDDAPDLDLDLSDLSERAWVACLSDLGGDHGFFERLGRRHAALFIEGSRDLLVNFESVESARRSLEGTPRGFVHATRSGWSLLSLLSWGDTWFRDPDVWGLFDRLTDDGFFERFDRVLLSGNGPGGYAAAAFSVAAPGCRVLALRPYATLDPAVAGWDRRHRAERRRDFTSRYGYAPAMAEAAERVWVVHDPRAELDAMHAALFAESVPLRAPWLGARVEAHLEAMGLMAPLHDLAMEGRLDAGAFAALWRERRRHGPYLRTLLRALDAEGRVGLARRVCRHGLGTRDRPYFERRLGGPDPARGAAAAAE